MRMGRVSRLGIGDGDGDTVDLHAVVGGDEDEAPPVDDPGLHHIAVLRRHGDLHLRGGDLEFSGLDDVPGVQGGVLAVLPAEASWKASAFSSGTPLPVSTSPTSRTDRVSGSGSRLSLCSWMRPRSCSWTACTTS